MFDKLSTVETRYDELMTRLGTVEVQSDAAEYKKAAKALAELEPLVQKYREYKAVEENLAGTIELARGSDAEMRALAEEELPALTATRGRCRRKLTDQASMLPTSVGAEAGESHSVSQHPLVSMRTPATRAVKPPPFLELVPHRPVRGAHRLVALRTVEGHTFEIELIEPAEVSGIDQLPALIDGRDTGVTVVESTA